MSKSGSGLACHPCSGWDAVGAKVVASSPLTKLDARAASLGKLPPPLQVYPTYMGGMSRCHAPT